MTKDQVANRLDLLGFPTFASSVRHGDPIGLVLHDFRNPPSEMENRRAGYREADRILTALAMEGQ